MARPDSCYVVDFDSDSPEALRLAMRDADAQSERASLAFQRGEIDEIDLWFWLAAYQARWTDAARRLAQMGLA